MAVTIDGSLGVSVPAGATGSLVPQAQEVPAVANTQFGMRNKIINGKMEIAQRGTSFAAATFGAYTLDRWVYTGASSCVATVSQQSDVPGNNEFQSSLRVTVTTADTSIAASDVVAIQQSIEGYNVRDLIGRTITLSFWARSSKSGTHRVSLSNGSPFDRSYVVEYAINAANTWEFKTIVVVGGLITAGTWNWTNGSGVLVRFALAAGSTYQTTPNAWQTGNFLSTANQVNVLDTVGNIFAITGVQLELGAVASEFEHRPYGTEFALCQRYYEKSDEFWTQVSGVSITVPFKVTKRATPTISAGSATVSGSAYIGLNGFRVNGSTLDFTWTAASEL